MRHKGAVCAFEVSELMFSKNMGITIDSGTDFRVIELEENKAKLNLKELDEIIEFLQNVRSKYTQG